MSSNTYACVRGQMGSTLYYLATMRAQQLTGMVRPAQEMTDTWSTWGVEDRLQREISFKRVRDQIVPYLANAKDRFFGSMIVLAYDPDVFEFEPLEALSRDLPAAYQGSASMMGFLTIKGGNLIMLDGQHRLVAFREVVQGNANGEFTDDVPNDEVSVIFIDHESDEKTRRIFNRVNRYAKKTSTGDNIITSEDDGIAIVTRWLLRPGEPLGLEIGGDLLVNWRSNTLSVRSKQLSTISAVYEINQEILAYDGRAHFTEISTVNRPSDSDLDSAYSTLTFWWNTVLEKVDPLRYALENPDEIVDMRRPGSPNSLLFKPVGQVVLFKGLIGAVKKGMVLDVATCRANLIDWKIGADRWRGTVVNHSGRMSTGKAAKTLASNLLTYMLGVSFTTKAKKDLKAAWNEVRGNDTPCEELPTPVKVA